MRQRIEVFVVDGGQVEQADAAINRLAVTLAAVDGHRMAARGQPDGKLFRERLESAVIGRNAARSENGDAHSPVF